MLNHSCRAGIQSKSQGYPLSPSVEHLLREHGLTETEAAKIPASGPHGRLLKGDVLAYLGSINASYPADLSSRLSKLGHMDLRDVKIVTPNKPSDPTTIQAPTPSTTAPDTPPPDPPTAEIALPISLAAVRGVQERVQHSLGIFLPLSTFISRATEIANHDLPRSNATSISADELFNAVLGLDQVTRRHHQHSGQFRPRITSLTEQPWKQPGLNSRTKKEKDIYDVLLAGTGLREGPASNKPTDGATITIAAKAPSSTSAAAAAAAVSTLSPPTDLFRLSVVDQGDDEKRARTFLERVKSVLEVEPGRLIL